MTSWHKWIKCKPTEADALWLYRLRYAVAFASEFTPFWRHPICWLQYARLGFDDFDAGDAADHMADYRPEEAANESAWYWRDDT